MDFNELRKKYNDFIYHKYEVIEDNDNLNITYYFEIPGLTEFNPKIIINKNIIKNELNDFSDYLIFHIGLIVLIYLPQG